MPSTPAEEAQPGPAATSGKVRVTYYLEQATVDRLRGYIASAQYNSPEGAPTQMSDLINELLDERLGQYEHTYNDDRPFKTPRGKLGPGRSAR